MSRLKLLDLPADRMEGDAVAALFFQDERPPRGPAALLDWRLNGLLTRLLAEGEAEGRPGESLIVPNNGKLGADRILFGGGGCWKELGGNTYRILIGDLLAVCRRAGLSRISLALRPLPGEGEAAVRKRVQEALAQIQGIECLLTVSAAEGFHR